ncbi:hypothetical protein AAU61_04485 [Desulfocarbo indianensis]|nr:hypothetical protein AAU61_04485 [Desulfocarbo indianensis]
MHSSAADLPSRPDESRAKPVVVAIGSGAGSCQALRLALPGLPADLAYVLVRQDGARQNCDPSLINCSGAACQVRQATDGQELQAGVVHVCPPDQALGFSRGRLALAPRDRATDPFPSLDSFFSSLAHDQGAGAVAVVLAGEAADSALGVRAVKAAGGLVLVQDPATCRRAAMPRAALATGLADLTFAPENLGPCLEQALGCLAGDAGRDLTESMAPDTLHGILKAVYRCTGCDFRDYKTSTIRRRVARRMALHRLDQASVYLDFLRDTPEEQQKLCKDILVSVTSFFRDPQAFAALRRSLSVYLASRDAEAGFRAWVPGCASGEEAYSLGILLAELWRDRPHWHKVQIFATDLDGQALAQARRGVFRAGAAQGLDPAVAERHFAQGDGLLRARRRIRERIIFARQNLIQDPPFSGLDLISCRNLLIYFSAPLQEQTLGRFHFGLKPEGILFLGQSESLGGLGGLFRVADKMQKVFTRLPGGIRPRPWPRDDRYSLEGPSRPQLEADAARAALGAAGACLAVVNQAKQALFILGDGQPFLSPAPARDPHYILDMAHPRLRAGLAMALSRAALREEPVSVQGLAFDEQGIASRVDIHAKRLGGALDGHLAVIFLPRPAQFPPSGLEETGPGESLHRKLAASQKHLSVMVEDMQAANQELVSLCEEAQAANEELDAANQELDTANQELSASNEELATINQELETRSAELGRLKAEMEALLQAQRAAVVFLDRRGLITRITPEASGVLGISAAQVGQPLETQVLLPQLSELASKALYQGLAGEELIERNGSFHLLKLHPIAGQDDRPRGAVLCLQDVTREQMLSQELRALDEESPDIIARLDRSLRYTRVNRAMEKASGLERRAILGKTDRELGVPCERCQPWEAELAKVFASGRESRLSLSPPPLEPAKRHQVRLLPELGLHGGVISVLSVARDVTYEELSRERLSQNEARLRRAFDLAEGGMALLDLEGRLLSANRAMARILGKRCEECLGREFRELLIPSDRPAYERARRHLLTGAPGELAVSIGLQGGALHRTRLQARLSLVRDGKSGPLSLLLRIGHSPPPAGELTHDLNNYLCTVLGNAEIALEDAKQGIATPRQLEIIFKAGRRASRLLREMEPPQTPPGGAEAGAAPASPGAPAAREEDSAACSGMVLLVDDEELLLDVTRRTLQKAGYQVLCAHSGEEALQVFQERGRAIGLVLLDMAMPGMGGGQCLARLRELAPELPVVLSTGFAIGQELRRLAQGLLAKPFHREELLDMVRQTIAKNQ